MALHVEPPRRNDTEKVRAGEVRPDHRLSRDGVERIGHGALVCPSCNLPVAPSGPVGAGEEMSCGYCDEAAPAREFLTRDVYDTVGNEVYLVARLAA